MKTVININRHIIKANKDTGQRRPPLSAKNTRGNNYGHEIIIDGPCRITYDPDNPLKCGATAFITTDANVTVLTERPAPQRRRRQACTT